MEFTNSVFKALLWFYLFMFLFLWLFYLLRPTGQRFRYTYYDESQGEIYRSIEHLDKMVNLFLWPIRS